MRLEEQQGRRVRVGRMNVKFVDIEESNNFDKNYLFKDLLKTIAEHAPTLDQIDSLQAVHFCPHAPIWPLEHLNDIRDSLRQELGQGRAAPSESTRESGAFEKSVGLTRSPG